MESSDGNGRDARHEKLHEWIKLGVLAASIVGSVYYTIGHIDSHIANQQIHHSRAELAETFVTRREWERNLNNLKDDIKYLRHKVDAIYDRLHDERRGGK